MKEIFKFKYNNYYLCLFNDKNKFIKKKIDKDNNIKETNEDENNLIDLVFNKIIPSKKIINLGNIKYNKKDFIHLYSKNNIHIFYEINNGKLYFPIEKDQILLNSIYNNYNEFFAINDNTNNKYFKKIINIGKKVVVVFIALNISFNFSILNVEAKDETNIINVNKIENNIDENINYNNIINEEDKLSCEEIDKFAAKKKKYQ